MSVPNVTEDIINELAKEIAEVTLTEITDIEFEAYMDASWAEHEAMLRAANSYDDNGEF